MNGVTQILSRLLMQLISRTTFGNFELKFKVAQNIKYVMLFFGFPIIFWSISFGPSG